MVAIAVKAFPNNVGPIGVAYVVEYFEIRLDLNESNSDDLITLEEFQIYLSGDGAISTYDDLTDDTQTTKVYDMDDLDLDGTDDDGGAGNTIFMAETSTGSGTDDYTVFIEKSVIDAYFEANPGENYEDTFFYLYTSLGREGDYDEEAGFDEWNVQQAGSIYGFKFDDDDGDGVFDEGVETGLGGITVYIDANNNGLLDDDERSTVTDEDGNFVFHGVAVSDVDIIIREELTPEQIAAGMEATNGLIDGNGSYWTAQLSDTGDSAFVEIGNFVPRPGINVVKSADVSSVDAAGDDIVYTYTVTNTGNISLTGVTLEDDNYTSGNAADDFNPSFVGGDTDGDGELDIDETWTYTATHSVTQAQMDDGSDLVNVATVDSNETGPDTDDETVTITQTPGIDLEKLVSVDGGHTFADADEPMGPEANIAGGDAIFRIEIENTGNVTLTNFSISDVDSNLGAIDLSGVTIHESISNDGHLEVGETAWLTYSAPLTAGQHQNIATVTTDQGASDSDAAHYFGLASDGPGVRTPGGWGNSFKLLTFWDGIDGNEIGANKEKFPDAELLYSVDVNGDNVIDLDDGDQSGETGTPYLMLGDYNRNGIEDAGETTLIISYDLALQLLENRQTGRKLDKRDDVARQATATWLNYLAGNEIGEDTGGVDPASPRDWLDEAIDWLLKHGDKNPADDGILDLKGGIVRGRHDDWREEVDGISAGREILHALDEYNNFGTVDGVIYAHDADDAVFVSALNSYSDTFIF